MKIIPAIDLMDGQVVRLYKGDPRKKTVYGDDPAAVARQWQADGADMLHVGDLDATLGRGSNAGAIKQVLESVDVPVEVAGGLRTKQLVTEMAQVSQRVVIGTLAFADRPSLVSLLEELGPDRVVISVDHRDGRIVTHGWQRDSGAELVDAAKKFLGMGFTEFLLTHVARDGTLEGPDLEYLGRVCDLPGANVIASGGISGDRDVADVLRAGASGVILGKALYDNKVTIGGARRQLA